MITFDTFERLLDTWKENFRIGAFTYADASRSFRSAVREHFAKVDVKVYGIYILRQRDTRTVLYIGKGGTVDRQGHFKGQDVPGRLRNVRGKDEAGYYIGADQWFQGLAKEQGALVVEYLVLKPPVAPAYVEAALLQAYLAEHLRLPPKNISL